MAGVFLDFWRWSFLELSLHYFNWPTDPFSSAVLSKPLSLDCAFLLTISSLPATTSAFVSRSTLVLQGFRPPSASHLPWHSHTPEDPLGIAGEKLFGRIWGCSKDTKKLTVNLIWALSSHNTINVHLHYFSASLDSISFFFQWSVY